MPKTDDRSSKEEIGEVELPVEFNPGLGKFEPVLPLNDDDSKSQVPIERKRNNWAFWFIIIIAGLYVLSFLALIIINMMNIK